MKRNFSFFSDNELYQSEMSSSNSTSTTEEFETPYKKQRNETYGNETQNVPIETHGNDEKNKSVYGLFSYRSNAPFNTFELKALYKCSLYHWIQYFCIVQNLDTTDEIIECFNFYYKAGIIEQNDLNNIFEIVCNYNHTTFIKYLLERQDFTFGYYTFYKVYCTLAFNKKNNLIKILINYTNNNEELKYTPMGGAEIARYYGHDDTFELLGMHF